MNTALTDRWRGHRARLVSRPGSLPPERHWRGPPTPPFACVINLAIVLFAIIPPYSCRGKTKTTAQSFNVSNLTVEGVVNDFTQELGSRTSLYAGHRVDELRGFFVDHRLRFGDQLTVRIGSAGTREKTVAVGHAADRIIPKVIRVSAFIKRLIRSAPAFRCP